MGRLYRDLKPLDLSDPTEVARMRAAVDAVRSQLGGRYPLRVGGVPLAMRGVFLSTDPADPGCVVGEVAAGTAADAETALMAAARAAEGWASVAPEERAALLLRVCDSLVRRRRELIAWMAFDAGKNFREADGELVESVQHIAWMAEHLMAARPVRWASIESEVVVEATDGALGAGVVLAPFSFPAALPLGMAAAAIAMGNSVVLKPSKVAPVAAYRALAAFDEAGLPPGVLNVVTGVDPALREALVRHPATRFVAFIGSRSGGAAVEAAASLWSAGQEHPRRFIARTDGKAATIVTASADLGWAVREVVRSAFSYQGQKCTSTAHLVLLDAIHDEFLERLLAEVDHYASDRGPASEDRRYGPLVSAQALARVRGYASRAAREAAVLRPGDDLGTGHFIGPVVVDDVPTDSSLAREEIFGPFLSIMRAGTLAHAVQVATGAGTAPAAAAFTRDAREAQFIREHLLARALYLNGASTGPLAGVRSPSGEEGNPREPDDPAAYYETRTIVERYAVPDLEQ